MSYVDDVVKYHATIAVHGFDDFSRWPETGYHDRHFVFDASFYVALQPVVTLMHDLVYRKRRDAGVRMAFFVLGEFASDLIEPLIEALLRPCVQSAGFTIRL